MRLRENVRVAWTVDEIVECNRTLRALMTSTPEILAIQNISATYPSQLKVRRALRREVRERPHAS